MKIYYIIPVMLFFINCNNKKVDNALDLEQVYSSSDIDTIKESHSDNRSSIKQTKFKPDIKINSLELVNPESIIVKIGNFKDLITEDEGLPRVQVTSKNKNQKLTLVTFPGSSYNDVYQFIIEKNHTNITTNVNEDEFVTESGLKLGLSKEEIIELKGNGFINNELEDKIIMVYRIDDYNNSNFLQHYNMPSYFMEFTISKNKVEKIKFGFDYP